MRAEYKSGLIVLICLAAVVVIYNAFSSSSSPPPKAQVPVADGVPSDRYFYGEYLGEINVSTGEKVKEGYSGGFVSQPIRNVAEDTTGSTSRPSDASNLADRGTEDISADVAGSAGSAGRIVESKATNKKSHTTPAVQQIYTVKKGDKLWILSERFYGHGKHWHLIASANQIIDYNNLIPDTKLKIPPLPKPRPGSRNVALAGRIVEGKDGNRYYYIKKSDHAGCWTVAKKVYGDANYFWLIKKANPHIDPNRLRVGQKILIPPLPSKKKTDLKLIRSRALKAGEKWYIVQKGDTYSDISERKYGSSKYWNLIKRANPKVDPDRLRPGQRLIIPPFPKSTKTAQPKRTDKVAAR